MVISPVTRSRRARSPRLRVNSSDFPSGDATGRRSSSVPVVTDFNSKRTASAQRSGFSLGSDLGSFFFSSGFGVSTFGASTTGVGTAGGCAGVGTSVAGTTAAGTTAAGSTMTGFTTAGSTTTGSTTAGATTAGAGSVGLTSSTFGATAFCGFPRSRASLRVSVTVALKSESLASRSDAKYSVMPSALQQRSRSRASPSVTRRVGLLSSIARTNTSPSATNAMVLPSGESAASLTLRPTCLVSLSSIPSSAAVNASFSALAPSLERSSRQRSPSTPKIAVLPSAETARLWMSSAVKSVRRLPESATAASLAR